MGRSLGSLFVSLGLDAAEYTRGLTKAEYQTQQFARNTRTAIMEVAKVVGSLEVGRQVLESTKEIINQAAALNDLADITGTSVEEISRLSNQAAIAGTDFNTLQGYVSKLAVTMSKADEESKDAARALEYLGISTKDPAKAFQEIAGKLSQYEDGIGKVALATAIWGKQGAQVLPLLKDIADLQDVGATVTKKQADEAEALTKSYARLTIESRQFANVILNDAVPALNTIIERMNVGTKAAGSFGQGLESLISVNVRPGAIADQLNEVDAAIARIQAHQAKGGFNPASAFNEETLNSLRAQREIILRARQQRAALNAVYSPDDANVRDILMARKPVAAFSGSGGADNKAAKERIAEAETYTQSLLKQLQAGMDLSKVEEARAEIYRLERDAKSGLTDVNRRIILDVAEQLDYIDREKKAREEATRAQQEEEQARAAVLAIRNQALSTARSEADSLVAGNEQAKAQLILIRDGEAALESYNAELRERAAREKEAAAAAATGPGAAAVAEQYLRAAKALREGNDLAKQLADTQKFVAEQKHMIELQGQIFDSAADSVIGLANGTKSARQALSGLLGDLNRLVMSEALKKMKDSLLGTNSGPNLFDILGKLASAYAGSAGGSAGGFDSSALTAGYANGTMSAAPGLHWVGERGAELVNFRGGERVYTAPESARMAAGSVMGPTTINFTLNGPTNRPTQQQIAARVIEAVGRSSRRR